MPSKMLDYDGMLAVYENISKKRSLTEYELDRVLELKRKQLKQIAHAKYRAKNKEKLAEAKVDYRKRNRAKVKVANRLNKRRYRAANSIARIKDCERSKEWRTRNADLVRERKRRDAINAVKVHRVTNNKAWCGNEKANLTKSVEGAAVNCKLCLSKVAPRQRA